jgi:Uma2 family endonuclease
MTVTAVPSPQERHDHIVLEDVSWEFYEALLREIGDRAIRVTYDDGRLEIMSPLPKHERWGDWIDWLVKEMCVARSIYVAPLGSTTFKLRLKKKGLEPDKCYYVQHAEDVRELEEEFDPSVFPAPDLAVEIDITSRSVAREPIYAALGVRELWRFNGRIFQVRQLSAAGGYVDAASSLAFPFLPISEFAGFVLRRQEDTLHVLAEFREWVRQLP